MKNCKNGCHFVENHCTANFHLLTPHSLGLCFSDCQQKWKIDISPYEKMEKWLPFCGKLSYSKIFNYLF